MKTILTPKKVTLEEIRRMKEMAQARVNRASAQRKINVRSFCFGPQRAFVQDPAPYKTAVCSRRAGKSWGIVAELLSVAEQKNAPVLYFTHTRGSAKRIIWHVLVKLNRELSLGFEPNESDLVLKKGGRALVHLTGVDTKTEIEKIRGTPWAKAVGDEAQSLPAYMRDLVEEVLAPSFIDHDGSLTLIGTPGPVPVGYFYECTQNQKWSHHAWTVFENPHIKGAKKKLDEYLELTGYTQATPKVQREWFGKWMHDPNSLVFRYDPQRNDYDTLPFYEEWKYVIGVDIGFNDADALAVLAWSPESSTTWLVEELVEPKQDITTLARQIKMLWERYGKEKVNAIVMDTGGIGKKVAEELSSRWQIPVVAAQKSEKQVHIELLNDSLTERKMFMKRNSRFVHDSYLVEWDKDRSTPERRRVSDKYHSDICDAVLYAFRASLAWTRREVAPKPVPGTPEHTEAWRKEAFERTLREMELKKSGEWDELAMNDFGWGM